MPPKKKVCAQDPKNMIWTDDEMQLLLETVISFKSKKSYRALIGNLLRKNMNSLKMTFSKHFHQKISQDFIKVAFYAKEDCSKNKRNACKL